MNDEGRDRFEIPKQIRSAAEAGFDQARKAFEQFLAYAEKNVQTSLDYALSLLHAKDLTKVMRLHSDYVQSQMRSLAEQATEMGQIVSRAALDAAKPKT